MLVKFVIVLFGFFTLLCLSCAQNGDLYNVGVGIADITGPAAEINMMGYAQFEQKTGGIHMRQYSRAFIVDDGKNRVLFISLDAGMTSQLVYLEATKALKEKYNGLYNETNVCISSTHTHAGPAGFFQYVLYIITSEGFVKQSYEAMIQGILKSVKMAHDNMQPGYLFYSKGDLYNASINRSPTAYLRNPPEERAKYLSNVDKTMVLLKLTDKNKKPIGMINWFAVHCTSMNSSNVLISGDNKGYASQLFEREINGDVQLGKGPFVAAFAQANLGDVSPNIKGPRCIDTGLPCDEETSTCNGKSSTCIALGPGDDMFESTRIIGQRQYDKAMELFTSADEYSVSGPVKFAHQYVDMTKQIVKINETTFGRTCKPALGYSFGAGSTDGPGGFDFKQGTNSTNAFWNLVRDILRKPSKELQECQKPKPVFLATGEMTVPYKWQPDIVPTQILQAGQFAIVAVPGEFTTMSGRRIREAVKKVLDENSSTYNQVVIAGLSNTYSSYTTTFEEYQVQRYEGASTIYGQYSLQAYIQQFKKLANALVSGEALTAGPVPENLLSKQISKQADVVFDSPYLGKNFGNALTDPLKMYVGGQTVIVTFMSGHPRNDLRLESTFLTIERLDRITGTWTVLATDSDWDTKFYWKRTNGLLGHSEATVIWHIPTNVKPGKYRIQHFGNSKNILQKKMPYSGTSRTFEIIVF